MADFTSARRSSTEGSITSLGGAPSGAPSGAPWPTGAFSYSSLSSSAGGNDFLASMSMPGSPRALGVTGPQASGYGVYPVLSDAGVIVDRDTLSRMSASKAGAIPMGTGMAPTGGYYDAAPSAVPAEHDAPAAVDKFSTLPVTSVGSVIYRLRARDSSGPLNDPTRFVYWTSAVLSLASYTGPLPFGGPLVELTIMDSFS